MPPRNHDRAGRRLILLAPTALALIALCLSPCSAASAAQLPAQNGLPAFGSPAGTGSALGPGSPFAALALAPAGGAPVNTVAPSISGKAQRASRLTATRGAWTAAQTYVYQWEDCDDSGANCVPIPGASALTYTLAKSDEGHKVIFAVFATNADATLSASSKPTAVIAALAPVNSRVPTISGTVKLAGGLSASVGTWNASGQTYAYQWSDCNNAGQSCQPIPGASALTYTLQASDQGYTLVFKATATNVDGVLSAQSAATKPLASAPSVIPFLDPTLSPYIPFQSAAADPAGSETLSFITADATNDCTPMWNTTYTLAQAAQSPVNLDADIAAAQSAGQRVLVGFGGGAGTDLALACPTAPDLQAAYQSVINRYHASALDLDIEGTTSMAANVNARRAVAVAAVQAYQQSQGKPLAVWLTLPAAANGLWSNGEEVVAQMLAAGVNVAGVDVMTFCFGDLTSPSESMLSAAEAELNATAGQLQTLFAAAKVPLGPDGAWPLMGATIKPGVNEDSGYVGQTWTLANARGLYAFAAQNHLARLSEWSLNRDAQCPSHQLSDGICSGVAQTPLEFTDILLGKP